ncbi:MAG: cytochrome c3 family protein [Bryobacteraceae bacterium]
MRKLGPALLAAIAALSLAQKPAPPRVEEKLPKEPPEQPIPFSHKTHVAQSIKCTDCHPIKDPGFAAGFPKEAACMGCHASIKSDSPAIRKLVGFAKAKEAVPWARVYKVPDTVWFSHATHATDAKIECAHCHGPIAEREAVFKEKPTGMYWCMDCHAKRKVSNGCDFCHNSH